MADISFHTSAELKKIGLDDLDIRAFINQRVRRGAVDSKEKLEAIAADFSPAAKKILGELVEVSHSPSAGDNKLNSLELALQFRPLFLGQRKIKIGVGFTRQTEPELHLEQIERSAGVTEQITVHDISFNNPVRVLIALESGELFYEKVLIPSKAVVEGAVVKAWGADPLLGPEEAAKIRGNKSSALLQIDLQIPRKPKQRKVPPQSPLTPSNFIRNGQFEVSGNPDFVFTGYKLSVALVELKHLDRLTELFDTQSGELAAQIHLDGKDKRFTKAAATLPIVSAGLDAGGRFRISQTGIVDKNSDSKIKGWVWLLYGPDFAIGFRPDESPYKPAADAVVFLPNNLVGQPLTGLPQNVTEATLLAQPDVFADDPGSVCKPFSSTGRILGEKRFRTVLRVGQPMVASAATRAGTSEISTDGEERPVDFPRRGVNANNSIDYEADPPARFQAQSVAFGRIIEHVVRYRSNGYSLGNVAHSLTLIPRQKRRIMKVDFVRTERAIRQEASSVDDSVLDELDSQHDYDGAVNGEFSEWSRGRSSASAVGVAAGGGGVLPIPIVIGGGVSAGRSDSSASQEGARETAVKESQRLRDSIRRFGESMRNFEATVVKEVEQTESVTGVSEVVQNINYTRALTVVYYEILRHLRVDTEVGSVTECVFVPLPIKRFTNERISRHRKVLSRFARGWVEKAVFKHLDSILNNFTDGEVPDGERREHPLTSLSGSYSMSMGINMPVDGAPSGPISTDPDVQLIQTTDQLVTAWNPFAALLPMPPRVVAEMFAQTRSSPAKTEKVFREVIAPAMAKSFLDHLQLEMADGTVIPIDVTPQSKYKSGQTFRVAFDAEVDGTLTRQQLEHLKLRVKLGVNLPPGSYLDLSGVSVSFTTDFYSGSISQKGLKKDLLHPLTGGSNGPPPPAVQVPDEFAKIDLPPTPEDKLHLRNKLRSGLIELNKTLEANTFRYHKAIWRSLDPDELYTLLDGFAVSETDGRSLASVVERKPIGILGNCLVYATRTDLPLDQEFSSFVALRDHYVSGLPPADPMRISLPTSGLYARAHLDECVAAEEHNGSFDWVFSNNEPELADFPAGMFDSRRSETTGLTPTEMPQTIINLQNAPQAPAPTGLGNALSALTNGNAFRDITGLAGTQKSLDAAMANAASLANTGMGQAAAVYSHAAQLASDERAGKETREFIAALEQARNKGLVSDDGAKNSAQTFADRKAQGNAASGKSSEGGMPPALMNGDAPASHLSVAPNGSIIGTSKGASPPRKPDIIPKHFVVPIPKSREILFMGFKTGSSELMKQHKDFLEILAAQVGISIGDIESITGHASKAGSEANNEKLGMQRAKALFARLQKLLLPLGASASFEPEGLDKVSSEGERTSLRARFSDVEMVAKEDGANTENDPVEKAVVLKLSDRVDSTKMPRTFKYGGVDFTVINNFIFVGDSIICSPPESRLKILNRSSLELLNDNVVKADIKVDGAKVEIKAGDIFSNNTMGDVLSNNQFNNQVFVNVNLDKFILALDKVTGFFSDKPIPVEEKPQTEWTLHFFGPKMDDGSRTLFDVLKAVVEDLPVGGSASLDALAPQIAKDLADKKQFLEGQSDITDQLIDFMIDRMGLGLPKELLKMVSFGTMRFKAEIWAKDDGSNMAEGEFVGPGLMIGTAGSNTNAPILIKAPYTTKAPLKLSDWGTAQSQRIQEFSYLNNAVLSFGKSALQGLQQLTSALPILIDEILPFLPLGAQAMVDAGFNVAKDLGNKVGNLGGATQLRFKAMAGDDAITPIGGDAVPVGAELQLFAMAPGEISFVKKRTGG